MQAHRKDNHVMMEAEIGSYAAISQGTSVTIGSWKRQERTIPSMKAKILILDLQYPAL